MNKTLKEKVGRICCTSVQDARSSLYHQDDINVVKAALEYEHAHAQRVSMIKQLAGKIRRMEREGAK